MNENLRSLPGGALGKRPLHFIFLLDASGSMSNGGKIQSLNTAIREAIPAIQEVADRNPGVEVLVRALKFSTQAEWHVGQAVPVHDFYWNDIAAGGETAMGQALEMVSHVLSPDQIGRRALPPVLVLVSDGLPTDDFRAGLKALMAQVWGKQAVRLAVAIGQDADLGTLKQFIGKDEVPPVRANDPEALVQWIRVVSVSAVETSSTGGEGRHEKLSAELSGGATAAGPGSVW